MNKRGRISSAELEVAALQIPRIEQRPDADYSLTDEEAEVWRAVVDSLPASWIVAGALPVLSAYCRQVCSMRRLGQLVHQATHQTEPYDIDLHLRLIREHSKAAQVLKSLATSLRIAPQSTMRPETGGRQLRSHCDGPKPWE
ncbi:hypothetical protein EN833_23340 [Mesorhizobium sp. M4B.F.Ca.ET.190.01.1.1]|uniref:hypothetical protein n=1 Tax=unclassified Mesorhizobium TaxID=325217 RepID=UPI001091A47A|nr:MULTISPECIES: hypothetical protein [unclassified Mesorhizobium]TGR05409.1 hypothetical protein EN843_23330 [Mesorhizobium sp. M4B.F.Ca.ET.200.01.1.1]TGS15665.1 hypothetical protein EN833_23340 [Mesorhizobium sp. M4B.F.Ca.ET.190.01.1.1]TGT27725.1 hypothetical protein EN815_23315 [Mesorhizobium sp. M4B.F.Ca.ET.172.01.1.1]